MTSKSTAAAERVARRTTKLGSVDVVPPLRGDAVRATRLRRRAAWRKRRAEAPSSPRGQRVVARKGALKPAVRPLAAPRLRVLGRTKDGLLSHDVIVEGCRLHAAERPGRRVGRRAHEAIVLIHGAGLDHRDWTHGFLEQLPQEWRILALDRPGFGSSERPTGPAAALPATQARLLRRAAAKLGVERAVLVGHSWGAAAAMAWAVDAPDAVRGVACLSGAVKPWSLATTLANARRLSAASYAALAGDVAGAARAAIADGFAPCPAPPGYHAHIASSPTAMRRMGAHVLADAATLNGALSLLAPRYGRLERPVELVHGACDGVLDAAEQLAAAAMLPRARATLAAGAGHMVHHARPELCVSAIRRLCAH